VEPECAGSPAEGLEVKVLDTEMRDQGRPALDDGRTPLGRRTWRYERQRHVEGDRIASTTLIVLSVPGRGPGRARRFLPSRNRSSIPIET